MTMSAFAGQWGGRIYLLFLGIGLLTVLASCAGGDGMPQTDSSLPRHTTEPLVLINGRQAYEHYCLPCHGSHGKGDGLNAYNLNPKPFDFTDQNAMAQRTDAYLAKVIREGGAATGHSNLMPPWGRTIGVWTVEDLVAYLRTFPAPPAGNDAVGR